MKLRNHLVTALLAAALCVMAPVAVPLGVIPVTLATLGVYLSAGLLGPMGGCAAVALYLALGAVGVPVFAGFSGGFQQFAGPTGGFLWGYLLCALVAGLLCRRWHRPASVALALGCGAVVLYALGGLWYGLQTGIGLWAVLLTCVAPCLPGELVKIAVATALILSLRERVGRVLTAGIKEQRL